MGFRGKVAVVMPSTSPHRLAQIAIRIRLGLIPWLLLNSGDSPRQTRYNIPDSFSPRFAQSSQLTSKLGSQYCSCSCGGLPGQITGTTSPQTLWRPTDNEVLTVSALAFLQMSGGPIRFDASNPYSPNRDGAVILQTYLNQGNRVDVAIHSPLDGQGQNAYFVTGLEPYFSKEPFGNMPFRFWFWGWGYDMRPKYLQDTNSRSAVILVEEVDEDPRYRIEEKRLESLGYQRDKVVCGQTTYPPDSFTLCHAFYKP
jgi:hypothetical protein